MRRAMAWTVLVLAAGPAAAQEETFAERVEAGRQLAMRGEYDEALAVFRDLQTDRPDADLLEYNIGCVEYERALSDIRADAGEPARAALDAARQSFQKAAAAANPEIRRRAAYNEANAVAQWAKLAAAAQEHDQAVEAFESAVAQYEAVLARYPDHAEARHNLEHMRYLLKRMLQNPPESPPSQSSPQPDENQDPGEQDENEQGDAQPSEGGEQSDQPQDRQDEQNESTGEEQEPELGQEEDEEQQGPGGGEDSEPQEERTAARDLNDEPPTAEERRNLEAILQSLEDQDHREQSNRERLPSRFQPAAEWW